ncbi:Something about silencing protein 10 like [Verticillium longisporum]|uniref:Something about silencing protein 10 like n=1 Tax=Verticillium longisporum TaxID=100787 RepID=A0A8I2Z756_VERLO|nr:Something about silencing protein 10 like [Verticillium longisporum]KAG7115504.1 Something about silencing protein 10 like [Verticillium longisporum]
MGKKRKASSRNAQPTGPKELDAADARLGPITTYKDVADSEEEYFINRDKIMFDEEPRSKRARRVAEEDKFLEQSDEEILDEDMDSEDEDEKEEAPRPKKGAAAKDRRRRAAAAGSDDEAGEQGNTNDDDGEQGDSGWWGDAKTDYYDNDQIETEADALEEEAEAKRLQQKKLAKMAEEDFLFDEGDWLAARPDGDANDGDEDVVTEVLQDVAVTDDMTPEARSTLLAARYPEFEYLVREFRELQPRLVTLQKAAHGKSGKSLEAVRYWILGCYVAALASYFAILTSPARDGASTTTFKILAPAELRDHEVMETLVTCREAWQKLDAVRAITAADESMDVDSAGEEDDTLASIPAGADFVRPSKADKKIRKAKEKAQKEKAKRAQAVEDSFADLDGLLATTTTSKKARKSAAAKRGAGAADEDGNSDFGEEEELDARTAADKAARKKSLRFYTSQIVQKANRRAGAGRDAGGDADIPYRERLRDRQARLNAEAEKRGQKGSKYGEDLGADPGGDESNDEDAATAKAVRAEEDDEYYDMVAARSGAKKADKAARQAALAAAGVADRVVEQEVIGPDGKRSINYTIEKNKGLAPKRKKENRNPRVKKKLQYEAKQKKLRSMMSTYKGGEPQGGYGGEKTGITTGLVRARKL